jgi:transposase
LRLTFGAGVSGHEIARRLGISPSAVRETLKRVSAVGLAWPLPEDLTDTVLEDRLYGNAGTRQGYRRNVEPDWAVIHRELKRSTSRCRRDLRLSFALELVLMDDII